MQDSLPVANMLARCFLLAEEQVDSMIAEVKNSKESTLTRRKKRNLVAKLNKWSMPVPYMITGTYGMFKHKVFHSFQL